MNWDPVAEHQAGVLCEKGFMKERYDNQVDELIRTFTPKGIDVVKDILKDKNYQRIFIQILYSEIKELPKESQIGVVNEVMSMLNGGKESS